MRAFCLCLFLLNKTSSSFQEILYLVILCFRKICVFWIEDFTNTVYILTAGVTQNSSCLGGSNGKKRYVSLFLFAYLSYCFSNSLHISDGEFFPEFKATSWLTSGPLSLIKSSLRMTSKVVIKGTDFRFNETVYREAIGHYATVGDVFCD